MIETEKVALCLYFTVARPGGLVLVQKDRVVRESTILPQLCETAFVRTDKDGKDDGPYFLVKMESVPSAGYQEFKLTLLHENAEVELREQ